MKKIFGIIAAVIVVIVGIIALGIKIMILRKHQNRQQQLKYRKVHRRLRKAVQLKNHLHQVLHLLVLPLSKRHHLVHQKTRQVQSRHLQIVHHLLVL